MSISSSLRSPPSWPNVDITSCRLWKHTSQRAEHTKMFDWGDSLTYLPKLCLMRNQRPRFSAKHKSSKQGIWKQLKTYWQPCKRWQRLTELLNHLYIIGRNCGYFWKSGLNCKITYMFPLFLTNEFPSFQSFEIHIFLIQSAPVWQIHKAWIENHMFRTLPWSLELFWLWTNHF